MGSRASHLQVEDAVVIGVKVADKHMRDLHARLGRVRETKPLRPGKRRIIAVKMDKLGCLGALLEREDARVLGVQLLVRRRSASLGRPVGAPAARANVARAPACARAGTYLRCDKLVAVHVRLAKIGMVFNVGGLLDRAEPLLKAKRVGLARADGGGDRAHGGGTRAL